MTWRLLNIPFVLLALFPLAGFAKEEPQAKGEQKKYCVVVSTATCGDAEWQAVVKTLEERHGPR